MGKWLSTSYPSWLNSGPKFVQPFILKDDENVYIPFGPLFLYGLPWYITASLYRNIRITAISTVLVSYNIPPYLFATSFTTSTRLHPLSLKATSSFYLMSTFWPTSFIALRSKPRFFAPSRPNEIEAELRGNEFHLQTFYISLAFLFHFRVTMVTKTILAKQWHDIVSVKLNSLFFNQA